MSESGQASTLEDRRQKKAHSKAFVLAVHLQFSSIADRDAWVETFKPLAKYVKESEPETLAYEVCIADNDPCKLMVYERYASKEALTDVHQKSAAYLQYKADGLLLENKPLVTGQSYFESDLGYM